MGFVKLETHLHYASLRINEFVEQFYHPVLVQISSNQSRSNDVGFETLDGSVKDLGSLSESSDEAPMLAYVLRNPKYSFGVVQQPSGSNGPARISGHRQKKYPLSQPQE